MKTAIVAEIFEEMRAKLEHVVPAGELYLKAELVAEIRQLKRERNAVVLGHNYMEPALYHTICDFKGDSLELARVSAKSDAEILVFCGVGFMAETAKILNPERMVLIPSLKAGCSLAESITAADVRKLREDFPGVPVVSYVNTFADVKAETDVCVTSSNAAKIVNALKSDTIIFLPDEYLARNVALETGKKIIVPGAKIAGQKPEPGLISWHGKCMVHDQFSVADIEQVRAQFPNVTVLAHPECTPEVCAAADFSGSTSAMTRYVREHPGKLFFLLTECSMGDNIIADNPGKDLVRLCSTRCPHMAQITLEMTRDALLHKRYEVHIPEDIRVRAKRSLDRMLELS